MRGEVLGPEIGLGFHQPDGDPTVLGIVDQDGTQQRAGDFECGPIEPAPIGWRGQKARNGSMSLGTKGLRMKLTIGSSHSRNQLRMNDSFMIS